METQFRLQPSPSAVNSAARPLLMPPTSTGPQGPSGQSPAHRGSIPKYFPETFKDFFSMLAEDEEHNEVISSLLEDKVIPRTTSNQNSPAKKRCEKPFCCHNAERGGNCEGNASGIYLDTPVYSGGGLTRTLSSKYYRRRPSIHRLLPGDPNNLLDSALGTSSGSSLTSLTNNNSNSNNFGRSNSFRLHRTGPSVASTYSSYLSYQPVDRKQTINGNIVGSCKHIQYCCLHQQQQQQQQPPLHFQPSSGSSTLSLNERSTTRLLPISPGAPLRVVPIGHPHKHPHNQHHTQDGTNFSDDEKKILIYPQLASGAEGKENHQQQQQKHRYSLLTKSYDQINRSRIFEPTSSSSEKSRRSSCDTPDQHPPSGTDQTTLLTSHSLSTTTSVCDEDDFDGPSTIKYKLIAGGGGGAQQHFSRTLPHPGGKSQHHHPVNIITNPLVRQYPFETNYQTKKMVPNETIVTQGGANANKTITSYDRTGPGAVNPDLRKSPLVNRRRSSSVTLPQPPIPTERYLRESNHQNVADKEITKDGARSSRDRHHGGKSSGNNAISSAVGVTETSAKQSVNQTQQQPLKSAQQQMQQARFGKQKQRMRTASMPAENRRPRLAEMRRSAIHCADVDIEYYRLRSFSITSHGICNLGDSMRSRRSRSINSVTSTGTSNSGRDRNNSNASQTLNELNDATGAADGEKEAGAGAIPAFKVAMLGSSGVGKTALTYQFTTSEYICAYDLSLDDDYGQKTVSVLLNGQETDLEVVDHPACEMSTEAFCATYSIDIFVVVYSIVDRKSFKAAERVLQYLRDNDCLLTRGAILVGNKTDLERQREVSLQLGKKLAKEIGCKFIETSSGIDHNVDELLVGIVAQVKLNPQRINRLTEKQKLLLATHQQQQQHFGPNKFKVDEQQQQQQQQWEDDEGNGNEEDDAEDGDKKSGKMIRKRQGGHSTGPLNSLDLHSLKRSVMTKKQGKRKGKDTSPNHNHQHQQDLKEEDEDNKSTSSTSSSSESLCSSSRSLGSLDRELNKLKTRIGSTNSTPIKRSNPRRRAGRSTRTTDGEGDAIERDAEDDGMASCSGGVEEKSSSKSVKGSPVKFSNRTKMFLASFLKFRKSLRMRRRSSSSCSDFFVI